MSVGADQALGSQRSINRNFHGCLENLEYNGVNLIDLAKQRDQRVTLKVKSLSVKSWRHQQLGCKLYNKSHEAGRKHLVVHRESKNKIV